MASASDLLANKALQKRAFDALAAIFTRYEPQEPGHAHPHPPLEIEVLDGNTTPPDDQLILEDEAERAIGIPKKVLIAAFLHARQLFMSTPASERESKEIQSATQIILLYDPEFLTAANARKQYLLNILNMKAAYGPMHTMMLDFAVQNELWFLTSILTSPLHRQTKSPTLWYQRAWLQTTFTEHCPFMFATNGYLFNELDIVLKASERHPKNYYAFQYARRTLLPALEIVHQRETNDVDGNEVLNWKILLDKLLKWCKAHPSDISGWSFLAYWIDTGIMDQELAPGEIHNADVATKVLKFAVDLQWKGEALWSFLRTISDSIYPREADIQAQINRGMAELCPKLVRSAECDAG